MNRNYHLYINLGIQSSSGYHPGNAAQLNGGQMLVHSSSDGHIDLHQRVGKTVYIFSSKTKLQLL